MKAVSFIHVNKPFKIPGQSNQQGQAKGLYHTFSDF